MADIEKAIKVAERIKDAILKKFPKYEGYVRRYDSGGDNGYIEIMIKPENGGRAQEMCAAYADEFFLSITDATLKEKATKIYEQFKTLVGAK